MLVDGIDAVAHPSRGPAPHRGHRPVRRARRLPHHRREPRAGRPPGRPAHARPGAGPATSSTGSTCTASPPDGSASCPAGPAGESTWPPAWSPHRRCCSSTSPPPGSTRPPATALWDGRRRAHRRPAPRSCSPPSTSRRPTGSPTRSSSSTTAASPPRARPPSSSDLVGGKVVARHHPHRASTGLVPATVDRAAVHGTPTTRRRSRSPTPPPPRRSSARPRAGTGDVTDLEVASPSLDDVFFHLATHRSPRMNTPPRPPLHAERPLAVDQLAILVRPQPAHQRPRAAAADVLPDHADGDAGAVQPGVPQRRRQHPTSRPASATSTSSPRPCSRSPP